VIVNDEGRFLFAVNAGSNSVSSFRIRESGLELVDTAPSGGSMPTSRNDAERPATQVERIACVPRGSG
jgi:6-phosphogluconolactonase (cycloisomerase 2 family)